MKPFEITNNDGYLDADLSWELPKLGDRERSINLRLTHVRGTNMCYTTITYEVDGTHTELENHNGVFNRALWEEITGEKAPK